jgi:hypothetical protein
MPERMGGLDAVKQRLLAAGPALADAANKQLAVEAQGLADAIASRAPVRTGTLRITVRAQKIGDGAWEVVAGGEATVKQVRKGVKPADYATAKAGYTAGVFINGGEFDYSRAVEFGHRTPRGEHVPAEPFFFSTYRARRSGLYGRITTRVLDAAASYQLS